MNITIKEEELLYNIPEILISLGGLLLILYTCYKWKKQTFNIQMLNPLLKNDKLKKIEKLEKIEEIEENVILDELPSYSEVYNKN